jgi:hypothetical protein
MMSAGISRMISSGRAQIINSSTLVPVQASLIGMENPTIAAWICLDMNKFSNHPTTNLGEAPAFQILPKGGMSL